MVMDLGDPECRCEGIGMVLVGREKFLIGLDCVIGLAE